MIDLPFRPAKQLAALIRRKKVGCLELLETYIARMERYNPRLNASSPLTWSRRGDAHGRPTGPSPARRSGGRSTACR